MKKIKHKKHILRMCLLIFIIIIGIFFSQKLNLKHSSNSITKEIVHPMIVDVEESQPRYTPGDIYTLPLIEHN